MVIIIPKRKIAKRYGQTLLHVLEMNEEKSTIMKKGSEYKKEKNW